MATEPVRHPLFARLLEWNAARDEARGQAGLRRELPVWPRLMGGCHPNRDTLAAIERAGFEVEWCRGFHSPAAARAFPVAPRILGVARR